MSTADLNPSGQGTRGTWTTLAAGTTDLHLAADDYAGGAHNSDTDGVMGPNNGDSSLFLLLGDTPAGFDPTTISQVAIKSAYRKESAGVSGSADTVALFYQLFRSDETTAITDELSLGSITSTSYVETTDALTGTGSHTKTDWDGARLRIRQDYTVAGCGDTTTRLRVTAAQVVLTYAYTSTVAATTGGLSVAAEATHTESEGFTSTADLTTAGLAAAATAAEEFAGTLVATTAGLGVGGDAALAFTASAEATLGGLAVEATADSESAGFTAEASLTTAGLTASLSAAETFEATAAAATAGLSADATAVEAFPATVEATTAGLGVEVTALEAFAAEATLATAGLSVAATAFRTSPAAEVTLTTAGLSADADAGLEFAGAVEALLAGLSADALSEVANPVTSSAVLTTAGLGVTADLALVEGITGAATLTLAGLTCSADAVRQAAPTAMRRVAVRSPADWADIILGDGRSRRGRR